MNITCCSPIPDLPYFLAVKLEGVFEVTVAIDESDLPFGIYHGNGVQSETILKIQHAVAPFKPPIHKHSSLSSDEVLISIRPQSDSVEVNIELHSDTAEMGGALATSFSQAGLTITDMDYLYRDENYISTGHQDPFVPQYLRWIIQQHGTDAACIRTDDDEDSINVVVMDPAMVGVPPEQRFKIEIKTDDHLSAEKLRDRIQENGFQRENIKLVMDEVQAGERIRLDPGPLDNTFSVIKFRLQALLIQSHELLDISPEHYPVELQEENPFDQSRNSKIIIYWPVNAAKSGNLRPYAGNSPRRFSIKLHCDGEESGNLLRKAFLGAGFDVLPIETDLGRAEPFLVSWGTAAELPSIRNAVTEILVDEMRRTGADTAFEIEHDASDGQALFYPDQIEIKFPEWGVSDGRRSEIMSNPAGCSLYIKTDDTHEWRDLYQDLSSWGFDSVSAEAESWEGGTDAHIQYGGASNELLKKIKEHLSTLYGLGKISSSKKFLNSDTDIYLFLSSRNSEAVSPPTMPFVEASSDTFAAFANNSVFLDKAFIADLSNKIRVGALELSKRKDVHPSANQLKDHPHFCLDQVTADTLDFVAQSVQLREPCLLEGETATSKSSVIQYLGTLTGHPVLRISLSGQTDVSELIGRPFNISSELPFSQSELLESRDLLSELSQEIIGSAIDENRSLNSVEQQKIMALEGFQPRHWGWLEGVVVTAIKEGWWLVLEELNLAESFVLERINSLLEVPPSIQVTEHNNERFGYNGYPIHPEFRIFATMNPAHYSGRSQLSPAYRDRWQAKLMVRKPSDADYRAMLDFWVTGQEPDVVQGSGIYSGRKLVPPFTELGKHPGLGEFLDRLADFHSALAGMNGQDGADKYFGQHRLEPYVFTRRTLLSVVSYISHQLEAAQADVQTILQNAIQRYYLGVIADEQDRTALVHKLNAVGLSPESFSFGSH